MWAIKNPGPSNLSESSSVSDCQAYTPISFSSRTAVSMLLEQMCVMIMMFGTQTGRYAAPYIPWCMDTHLVIKTTTQVSNDIDNRASYKLWYMQNKQTDKQTNRLKRIWQYYCTTQLVRWLTQLNPVRLHWNTDPFTTNLLWPIMQQCIAQKHMLHASVSGQDEAAEQLQWLPGLSAHVYPCTNLNLTLALSLFCMPLHQWDLPVKI